MRSSTPAYALVAVVLVLSLLSGGVGAVDGPTVAQTAGNQSTTTTTPMPSDGADGAQTTSGSDGGNTSRVVEQVDDAIVVRSYNYSDGDEAFTVVLSNTGDEVVTVTITEVVLAETDGKGSTTFGVQQVRLRPGETSEVVVDARRWDGVAGITITTPASIDAGSGVMLWDVEHADVSIFSGESTWGTVRAAWFFTMLSVGSIVVLSAWHVVSLRGDDVDVIDLEDGEDS